MDLVNDPTVREIWVMKSAQVGWTEILLNVIGYFVHLDPCPMLLVQPTLEVAEAFSKDRLAPMIRDTPVLTGKIADPKSRDSGNTLLHKRFHGGHVTLAGANSPAGLRSRPIRILLCDEVDGYPTSAGTEGDPFSLARKRTTAFWNRKILAGSTPTIKGQSRVEEGFLNSDQSYFHYACPHCGEWQRLVWEQVKWTEYGLPPEEAVYQCVKCGAAISEAERQQMLLRYRLVPTRESNGIAGLHINELMSPFVTLGEMARSYVEAKKLPETLQTWINTSLGLTYEDTARDVDPKGLASRREPYGPEQLPAGVLMVTLGVDTQDDRLELELVGWGREEESWILEHKVIRGDPGVLPTRGVWDGLTKYRRQAWRTEDGRTLRLQGTAVDFGGHFSQQVANYAHRYRFERVFAIRGQGGAGKLIWPRRPGKTKLSKADIYTLGVDTAKDVLYGRLAKIAVPGPGYIHLPAAVDDEFLEQLVAETKVYSKKGGRRVASWKPKKLGLRTEAQDCWIYAYAAMQGREADLNAMANQVEKIAAKKAQAAGVKLTPRTVAQETPAPAVPQEAPPATPEPEKPPPDPPPAPKPPAPRRPKKPKFRVFRSNYLRK